MSQRDAGKVTVITGAAAGIGRVYAQRFASEGANVVILDRTDGDAVRAAATQVSAEVGPFRASCPA